MGKVIECERVKKSKKLLRFILDVGGEQRQMYKVVCAECGKETEVPFEPKNDRPVYCRDCFSKRKAQH